MNFHGLCNIKLKIATQLISQISVGVIIIFVLFKNVIKIFFKNIIKRKSLTYYCKKKKEGKHVHHPCLIQYHSFYYKI